MTVLGYRHTGIICRDIKKSLYFYKNLLGLKISQEFWDHTDYINKVSGMKNAKVHFIKLKMNFNDNEIFKKLFLLTFNLDFFIFNVNEIFKKLFLLSFHLDLYI